jgi:dihydrofolate reductase
MRNLILKMSISVDGYVGGPQAGIDWIFDTMDAEATAWTMDAIMKAGLHAMGSQTFYDMVSYWPTSTEPFAAPMNEIPKAVFSRKGLDPARPTSGAARDAVRQRKETAETPALATWTDVPVYTGDLAEEIARLKAQPGKDIVAHGGAGFAQSLVQTGLIDEYMLLVHPVALGEGLRLFPQRVNLRLVSVTAFPKGAVAHVYQPIR